MHMPSPSFGDHLQAFEQLADTRHAQRAHPGDALSDALQGPGVSIMPQQDGAAMQYLLELAGGVGRLQRGKKLACVLVHV